MKTRKLTALILTAIMLISLVASCGDSGGSNNTGDDDGTLSIHHQRPTIDLVIYSQLANFSGVMTGWGAEILREKFNVSITIISSPPGTFQTRMEAGFLGDIILFGSDGDEYKDAAEAGLLFDWMEDDLLADYGYYIYTYFPYALGKNQAITGTLHGFGHNIAASATDHAAFYYYPHIRWDLYTQLGRPVINTLEDFIPVLEQMVALEPTTSLGTRTYGVSSFPDWDGDMVMMVKSTAALYGWEEFHIGLYDVNTQTWQSALHPEDEGGWYLRCLRFYNKLYQKGLFDPDSMTQTFDDVTGKYLSGAAMFNIFSWIADYFNTDAHKEADKIMMPVVAQDQKNLADGLGVYGENRVWAIGANSNYPELSMEIINWFSSPEGVLAYNYGPQGVTWDYDEDGEPYMTQLGMQAQLDGENTVIEYGNWSGAYDSGTFEHNNTTWALDAINPYSPGGNSFNWEFWDSTLLNRIVTPIEQSWRDWTGFVQPDDWFISEGRRSVAISSVYSPSRKSPEMQVIWSRLQSTIKDGSWRAIYANSDAEFDSVVAQMVSDAYQFGFAEAVEWMQGEVIARRDAENAVAATQR